MPPFSVESVAPTLCGAADFLAVVVALPCARVPRSRQCRGLGVVAAGGVFIFVSGLLDPHRLPVQVAHLEAYSCP